MLAPALLEPSLLEPIHPDGPDVLAQVGYASGHEWAVSARTSSGAGRRWGTAAWRLPQPPASENQIRPARVCVRKRHSFTLGKERHEEDPNSRAAVGRGRRRAASSSGRRSATASQARRRRTRPGRRCSRARSRSKGSRSTGRATCTFRSGEARPDARSCGSTRRAAPNQAGVIVARINPPCNPAGLAFGPDGRLYITGFGAAGDEIGVVTPSDANPATRRCDRLRNGDAGRQRRRVRRGRQPLRLRRRHRSGARLPCRPAGGAATVLFRVPPMANSVGVGRQNQSLQPPAPALPRRHRGSSRTGWRSQGWCALRRRHRSRRALASRPEQAR